MEIWRFAAERLKRNEPVVLLIVAESSGSSPGRQGFKMALAGDNLTGSIGGGLMEVNLVEYARSLLEAEKGNFVKTQVHQKNSLNSSGMICSGKQTVIFYRLDSKNLNAVGEIVRALKRNQPKILRVTPDEFEIYASTRIEPFVGKAQNNDFKFECKGESDFLFQEKLRCKNKLFIIGGGHCALALSELMSKMDFHISLFDDRPNLNTLDKNKFAHQKTIVESYEKIGKFITSGANHFVVVMTLGYKTDEIVIRELLDKNFKYFGVLGSHAKMATLLRKLRKEDYDQEKLNRIRTPIGLQINSRTPEEIAVSIAAEIISVKNSKD